MRARMDVSTRVVSEEPRTLYVGDVIEGPEAARQVALGHATELKPDKASEEKKK